MRWAIRSGRLVLLVLASCSSPAATDTGQIVKKPAHAVVLTERPVPTGGVEYVVRTKDGTTMAVVQPDTAGLHPGVAVTIVRGERTTLATK